MTGPRRVQPQPPSSPAGGTPRTPSHWAALRDRALSPNSRCPGQHYPGWRGTRAARALHLPELTSAAPPQLRVQRRHRPRVPGSGESCLRPIPGLNPVLCLVPRSPPSSRSRLLKKPGGARVQAPAPQPRRRGRRGRRTRGPGTARGNCACSVRGRRRRAPRRRTAGASAGAGPGARERRCGRVPHA